VLTARVHGMRLTWRPPEHCQVWPGRSGKACELVEGVQGAGAALLRAAAACGYKAGR